MAARGRRNVEPRKVDERLLASRPRRTGCRSCRLTLPVELEGRVAELSRGRVANVAGRLLSTRESAHERHGVRAEEAAAGERVVDEGPRVAQREGPGVERGGAEQHT